MSSGTPTSTPHTDRLVAPDKAKTLDRLASAVMGTSVIKDHRDVDGSNYATIIEMGIVQRALLEALGFADKYPSHDEGAQLQLGALYTQVMKKAGDTRMSEKELYDAAKSFQATAKAKAQDLAREIQGGVRGAAGS